MLHLIKDVLYILCLHWKERKHANSEIFLEKKFIHGIRIVSPMDISLTDFSPTDSSPNGHFPERIFLRRTVTRMTFPRTYISPNHVFHFKSKEVIDIN